VVGAGSWHHAQWVEEVGAVEVLDNKGPPPSSPPPHHRYHHNRRHIPPPPSHCGALLHPSPLRDDFLKDSFAHPSLPSRDSADTDELDDFTDDSPTADLLLSPSSWVPFLDQTSTSSASDNEPDTTADTLFVACTGTMISAASTGDDVAFATVAVQIKVVAVEGNPGAQSALAFLSGAGMTRLASRSLAFLLHKFTTGTGDLQSKMALAYSYLRQEVR
jgi:SEL1 protein